MTSFIIAARQDGAASFCASSGSRNPVSAIFASAGKIFVLFCVALLTSCSHMKKSDGPPDFYVDETKIPNAVPKPEPLAKYGNYKSYVVLGKRYYTLPTSKNYDEIGTASWYGTKFHDRKTSSGEPYDMLGMTAAHKTLPLPTYVEVTNLKNNRSIIVKVNDRGPFESNRIIDLSYVGAKKLGMLGHGTAKVRVRAINPYTFGGNEPFFADASRPSGAQPMRVKTQLAAASTRYENPSSASRQIYLQVGAFRNKMHAVRLQQQLSSLFTMPVRILNPSENGSLYRVKIGPFQDIASANRLTLRLRGMGITPNKTYGA
ncbi:RlpA-like protein [Aquicella siphonis]|uniref:Endolytic peptidoglycan transglycosylase RlpA n=1 Tax=Aquicella siphonis TaxID=254247 RepID=A0A5E4PGW7_9COXI|nr:septal ring lytic transglycosylase RlpA family protein [Aquicella siphonis]VVC76219.1 RlpA-like protein [Aquicella siphonis]